MPTVEAQIVGKVEKPTGWTRYETDARPRYLDTKRPDVIERADALMYERVSGLLEYSERQSGNINPHTQRPYVDYYLEDVLAGSNGHGRRDDRRDDHRDERRREPEPERRQTEPEDRGFGWRTHPVDAWRMTLGMAAKLAIQTLPLLPVEQRGPEDQWVLTLWWANRIWFQSQPSDNPLDEPMHPGEQRPGAYSEPYPDDDIPFGR